MSNSSLKRLVMTAAMLLPLASAANAADTYTLDASHTAIVWQVNHFGFSNPSGKFMNVDGKVTLDKQNPEKSSVNVTIPIATINSGVPKLDEHLKTKDFFDVEKFPTATFVSDKVEVKDAENALVHGTLTLHGVAKPVTLDVHLNKIGENMMKKQTAGFTASTTIKRSDFGMSAYVPNLSDEVKLSIESEANM